jgi:SAM-dependent methyltransferase
MLGSIWPKKPPDLTPEQARAREHFVRLWHEELPRTYSLIEGFNHGAVTRWPLKESCRTLEIGAGLGAHSRFEDLSKQEYHALELREEFCENLRILLPPDRVSCGDIEQSQPWPNAYFDRVVAIHVLEHLRHLPNALAEVRRLLKPDGCFDVVLPCEGGWAYALARKLSAERMFRKRFKMDYGPIIQNEHVSTLREVNTELSAYFRVSRRSFFPMKFPVAHVNLCVAYRLISKS